MSFSESVTETEFYFEEKEVIFIAGILILAGVLWLGFQITGNVPQYDPYYR